MSNLVEKNEFEAVIRNLEKRLSVVEEKNKQKVLGLLCASSLVWTPTGTTTITMSWRIPEWWNGKDFTVKLQLRAGNPLGGTAVMKRRAIRFRAGSSALVIENYVSMNQVPSDNNSYVISINYSASNFAVGDIFQLEIVRYGDDANDTFAGNLYFEYCHLEF